MKKYKLCKACDEAPDCIKACPEAIEHEEFIPDPEERRTEPYHAKSPMLTSHADRFKYLVDY